MCLQRRPYALAWRVRFSRSGVPLVALNNVPESRVSPDSFRGKDCVDECVALALGAASNCYSVDLRGACCDDDDECEIPCAHTLIQVKEGDVKPSEHADVGHARRLGLTHVVKISTRCVVRVEANSEWDAQASEPKANL